MKLRKSRLGSVVQCDHEYFKKAHGQRTVSLGPCEHKFVTACTDKAILQEQLRLAGWERVRFPGGVQLFCPDHTRKAIADRERAKREQATERIWK